MRIVLIGEAMLEVSRSGGGWALGCGGDTFNTAVHLARSGHNVAYLTALGADPFSVDLRRQWADAGLDISLVLTHPDRRPGLYAVATDAAGERSFTYWREASAARTMFALPGIDEAVAKAGQADLLAFSLITLAILPPDARTRLLGLARHARAAGGKVAFDSNYRPALWETPAAARAACDAAIACATIGLPTLEDETSLWQAIDPDDVVARWTRLGCAETVVKLGAQGCLLPDGRTIPPATVLAPLDTSGAGDAFNAGYLAARLDGATPADAARAGNRLAGWTVMRPGAIPPRDPAAPYPIA